MAVALLVGGVAAHAADISVGSKAYQRGDYATALLIFRQLADQGYVWAQLILGVNYSEGQGVPQDDDHPYSKRVLYIDRQMFVPLYALMYDREGVHIKTMFEVYGNPKFNPGNEHVQVPVWTGETMIGLYFQYLFSVFDLLQTRTHHLWLTA